MGTLSKAQEAENSYLAQVNSMSQQAAYNWHMDEGHKALRLAQRSSMTSWETSYSTQATAHFAAAAAISSPLWNNKTSTERS